MRIVHFSDWHNQRLSLPSADLYICTGDMLPNYPLVRYQDSFGNTALWDPESGRKPRRAYFYGRMLLPEREKRKQEEWISQQNFRRDILGDPDAPVLCVRGNHDFTDLTPLFGGDVWEVNLDSTRVWEGFGLRVGGFRGINFIDGEWNDEMSDSKLDEVVSRIPPDIDVLISHVPPLGILDSFDGCYLGCQAVRKFLNRVYYDDNGDRARLKLHCFGHIHEANGKEDEDEMRFSNAALSFREIEL